MTGSSVLHEVSLVYKRCASVPLSLSRDRSMVNGVSSRRGGAMRRMKEPCTDRGYPRCDNSAPPIFLQKWTRH